MKINFTETGWKDYLYWEGRDKKTVKKINKLIEDIVQNGYDGIGKPEALRGELSGWWSRHIDEKNRLLYRILGRESIEILECKGHYGDK
ncbi:MAG: Txe/YoeB family addiction module toxin [Planctomycetota bacterium]|jgi:toxin YoeB|nr:Txe/YoeB family addiction module toxin [Planctomycetota bacterium]